MGGRGHCLQAKERQALGKSAYAGRCSIRLSMATLSEVMHSALTELGRNLSCRSFRVVYVSLLEPVYHLTRFPFVFPGGIGRVVNGAFMVLKGHRSIVNQVRFNPHTYMICSSGVEKIIKVRHFLSPSILFRENVCSFFFFFFLRGLNPGP